MGQTSAGRRRSSRDERRTVRANLRATTTDEKQQQLLLLLLHPIRVVQVIPLAVNETSLGTPANRSFTECDLYDGVDLMSVAVGLEDEKRERERERATRAFSPSLRVR
ncbi:hypothetical protein MPTK1_5g05160 [Marchantia polymorpha subsp. ruderalis]|uniref:Uncharacterized protein n=2 Tax=Marchantia polymorpha TaxID=3197 RepID=A0AAF6BF44_MARPO|nr:hypothetical protein MARPO_0027s0110 [Marchantia polymorpha]BBN10628.1 hypothetical protein Mp_5g05160 [Marchantia polymorpha subsp. ruderalis]|eukprot:PTQ43006.1 hypothetical protein MARPO_0027s0110 [Marchantia polymorpha]